MKKKFSRILGVAVTLALVASLFGFAVPVAAQPGNMQWLAQPLPTGTAAGYFVLDAGSDVVDIARANDGTTIYAINGIQNASTGAAPWALYKSVDAGHSWAGIDLSTPCAAFATPLGSVAVAPDNPDALAISTRDPGAGTTDTVFISNTGGATWAELPAITAATPADAAIMDLAVAPARAGTVFGREYVVAVADETAGLLLGCVEGDVQIIGGTAAWASVDATNVDAAYDYMAVAVTPNFLGDRCVVAVGANMQTGSVLHIINTSLSAQVHARVVLNLTVDDFAQPATGILAADIALPSNFDPLTLAMERSYACTASSAIANDGVYRVDSLVRWELGLAGTAWRSVAYNGTLDTGKLFVGAWAAPVAPAVGPDVRYTTEMTVANPVWTFCQKPPTGQTGRALLRVAADYATTERVFAATSGGVNDESAFSVSNNAGVSFDQIGLIDNAANAANVVAVQGIALTPDAGTIFVATHDGVANMNLWKSATPVSPWSWSRVWCRAGTAGLLRLNPLWDDVPAIFLADVAPAGAIYVSTDGGDIFATNRSAPTGITATAGGLAVQDADTLYLGGTNNFVYKSTNAAFTWPYAPANPLVGIIISMQAPVTDHLLVGGTGNCSYSTDAGTTFTLINVGLPALATLAILADEGYAVSGDAGENIIYAGDTRVGAAREIYRFTIGTSTAWEAMLSGATDYFVGLAMNNGALYGMEAGAFTGTDYFCMRALDQHAAIGTITWRVMSAIPPTATIANFAAVGNKVYAASAGFLMWAYDDKLATVAPVVTGPADGYAVSIDPTTGNGVPVALSCNAMGTDTGLVSNYDFLIWETAAGIGGGTLLWTGPLGAFALAPAREMSPTAPTAVIAAHYTAANMRYTLRANTEYTWMMRACDLVSGDQVVSQWSDLYTLSVQAGYPVQAPHEGPILLGPVAGATNVSVTPGFSWTPIHAATEYEFILALDSALTQTVEGTPVYVSQPSWQVPVTPGTLEYDTAYFWGVKSTKPVESVQGIGSFQTMKAPTVFTCPICGETFDTETELSSHMDLEHPAELVTPGYIWGIIGIGAILVIVVLVLIVRTRRTV